MNATGVPDVADGKSDFVKQQFSEKFVGPLEAELVGGVRVALPINGGTDTLSGLILEVNEVSDD